MNFLLPRQRVFFDHFKALNTIIKESAELLSEFSISFKNFENFFVRAKEIEHRGDETTHQIINALNKTFITPFDREDIYALAQRMDDIVDAMERAIQTAYIYQIVGKRPGLDQFVYLALKASQAFDQLINECFDKRRYTDKANLWIVKIHELEDEADLLFQQSIQRLFAEEHDPLMVMRWKDFYYALEEIMDKFQLASDTVESIVVKGS